MRARANFANGFGSVRGSVVRFTILFREAATLTRNNKEHTASNHAFTVRYKLHLITRERARIETFDLVSIEGDRTAGEKSGERGTRKKKGKDRVLIRTSVLNPLTRAAS